jgi:hypothetical protein
VNGPRESRALSQPNVRRVFRAHRPRGLERA